MNRLSEVLSKRIASIDLLLKLFWLGLLGQQGIFIFIAYMFSHETASHHSPLIILIFSLIGITFMIMSLWLRYVLISPRAVAKYLDDKGPLWVYNLVHSAYKSSYNGMNDIPPGLDDTENKMLSYAIKSQILQMVLWGMLNSTAIFGLTLVVLLSQPTVIFAFVIPVFVVTLTQYPNTHSLLEAGLRERDLGR